MKNLKFTLNRKLTTKLARHECWLEWFLPDLNSGWARLQKSNQPKHCLKVVLVALKGLQRKQ